MLHKHIYYIIKVYIISKGLFRYNIHSFITGRISTTNSLHPLEYICFSKKKKKNSYISPNSIVSKDLIDLIAELRVKNTLNYPIFPPCNCNNCKKSVLGIITVKIVKKCELEKERFSLLWVWVCTILCPLIFRLPINLLK